MIPVVLAILIGVSLGLIVWVLKDRLQERWHAEKVWLEDRIWRFTPDPVDVRPYLAAYYGGGALVLFLLLLFLPVKLLGIAIWLVLMWLPRILLNRAWAKRQKLIDQQLAAAIRQLSSSVASGMTMPQAIERLADKAPDPIRVEFRIIKNYFAMGSDFNAAIEEAKRRLGLTNFNLFASSILINQRMGGNVTETLERIAGSLEAVETMRREVHAATAEGRTNIKVLAVAPFIMIAFDAVIDAEAVGWLFTRVVGHVILVVAAGLTLGGTLWAWKMVHADV